MTTLKSSVLWCVLCLFVVAASDSPRLRHVVHALQEQVEALQREQRHNRMVIRALETKLTDEFPDSHGQIPDARGTSEWRFPFSWMTGSKESEPPSHQEEDELRDKKESVDSSTENDDVTWASGQRKNISEYAKRWAPNFDPEVIEEDVRIATRMNDDLKKLRRGTDISSPLDPETKEAYRSELESLRLDLQKLRREVETQKSKYEQQEAHLNEMKTGQVTTKWIQKTVGDLRKEISELATALNISLSIKENQQLEMMLDRLRDDLSGIRSDLDFETAGLAKQAAIVDEMRSDLVEVRLLAGNAITDYQQLAAEVEALKDEFFTTDRFQPSQKPRLWDEGQPVEGSGSDNGSGSGPHTATVEGRIPNDHDLSKQIESVKENLRKMQNTYSVLNEDVEFLKQERDRHHSRIGGLEETLEGLDNKTTSAQDKHCSLSRTMDDVRRQLSLAEEKVLENGRNIVNITEAMTGMDKVHSSTVQLFEALESMEGEFSVNIGDLQREISKFEFNVAQVQGSFDILRHDQASQYRDMRALKSEFANMKQEFRKDHYHLTMIQNEMLNRSLHKCVDDNKENLQDLKLSNLELQLSKLSKREDDSKQQANMMYSKLMQKADRSSLQNMENSYRKVTEEFSNTTNHLSNVTHMQSHLRQELMKFVKRLPMDCSMKGIPNPAKEYRSGIYLVQLPHTPRAKEVYCDMDTSEDRRWTLVQRRTDGSEDFFRSWEDYKHGFGDPKGEYWLGNEALHRLTSNHNYTLRIDMWDVFDRYMYAEYGYFRVASEGEQYRLDVGEYVGNASDALRHHHGMAFSTHDRDNDVSSTHCAMYYTAGWWYQHCQYVNPNGRYAIGMTWYDEDNRDWMQLTKVEMKVSGRRG